MTTEAQREWQERVETLRNDARLREQQGTTLSQFAQAEAEEVRGRFTGHEKSTVIGSTPSAASQYPAGPTWGTADQALEPSLGIDVNAQEPTGEAFEVERSITAQEAPTLEQPPPLSNAQGNCDDSAVAPSSDPLAEVERAESSPFLKNEGED